MSQVFTTLNGKLRVDRSGGAAVVSDDSSEDGPCCCCECRSCELSIFTTGYDAEEEEGEVYSWEISIWNNRAKDWEHLASISTAGGGGDFVCTVPTDYRVYAFCPKPSDLEYSYYYSVSKCIVKLKVEQGSDYSGDGDSGLVVQNAAGAYVGGVGTLVLSDICPESTS
jgi:hypothetical protein